MTARQQTEWHALQAINTVSFAHRHNAVVGGESSVMQNTRKVALRLGHVPGTRAYLEFVNGCLEAAVKHFENPNPAPKHGWLCVTVYLDSNITAEAHFHLDADDDFEEIEVWVNGNDLWLVLSDEYQKDVLGQLHERLPALLRQRDREIEEERVGL